jgi:hypothetical protein
MTVIVDSGLQTRVKVEGSAVKDMQVNQDRNEKSKMNVCSTEGK